MELQNKLISPHNWAAKTSLIYKKKLIDFHDPVRKLGNAQRDGVNSTVQRYY